MRLRTAVFVSALLLVTTPLTVPAAHAAPTAAPAPASPEVEPAAEVTRETATTQRASAADLAELPAEVELPASPATVQTATAPVEGEVAIAAVTLPAEAAVEQVFLRTVVDGTPGEWTEVDVETQAGDPEGRAGTSPLVVSAADQVEALVVADTPVAASLQVYATSVTDPDVTVSEYAYRNPDILSRAAWQADESLVRRAYSTGVVTGAMIHHTATSNDYQPEDVPGILRSIQAYHVNGRGWNDIGYNFLVDKFGRAWEGRGGGVTSTTVGGHAWGQTNYRTFGIALLGDHSKAAPTSESLTTLQRIIAWKFRLHGVDPAGRTWGSSGQDGGSPHLPAISGHRDENATECPGTYVASRMSTIRANVRASMDKEFRTVQPLLAPPSARIAGPDLFGTAAEVSKKGFPDGAGTVFITTGRSFEDALAVGPWANKEAAPILLSEKTALPAVTRAELVRLNPTRVVLVGGPVWLGPELEAQIEATLPLAAVERVAGRTAALTSVAISERAFETPREPMPLPEPTPFPEPTPLPGTPVAPEPGEVLLASSARFPDGLVGGPLAKGKVPILLAPGSGPLPNEVKREIARLRATKVIVLGGPLTLAESIVTDLKDSGHPVERLSGATLYDTAATVARRGFPAGVDRVYLATGTNYPDALVTVGLQTSAPGPLLLSPGSCLPAPVIAYLKSKPGAQVIPIGGRLSLPIDEVFLPVCR